MSGFVVLFDPRGRPVDRSIVRTMFDHIAHRGPDVHGDWFGEGVGIRAGVLRASRASVDETQPFVDSSGCCVVFDGRIDDRDRLAFELGLPAAPRTDPELVAEAYRIRGDRFPEALAGDFAISVYDPIQHQLLVARDGLGLRPLFLAWAGGHLVIASEAKAILAYPGFEARPNRDLLAEVLLQGSARATTWDSFFEGIRAVPPGVTLRVGPTGSTWRTHWQIDPTDRLEMSRYDDYVEAFRSHFETAVLRRLNGVGPIAVRVSGGLDSSAIFCTALRLIQEGRTDADVAGFTWTFPPGSRADELGFVRAIEEAYAIEITQVPMVNRDLVTTAEEQVSATEMPSADVGWVGLERLLDRTREMKSRVHLTGFWGDQLLIDYAYLADLLGAGRIKTLARHMRLIPTEMQDDLPASWPYRRFLAESFRWNLPRSMVPVARAAAERGRRNRAAPWYSESLRALSERPGTRPPNAGRSRASAHGRDLMLRMNSVYSVHGRVSESLVAGRGGFEEWMPMLDRDLVRFVAAIPGEVVTSEGRARGLMRDAMRGTVPDAILARRSKADGVDVVAAALNEQIGEIEGLFHEDPLAASLDLIVADKVRRVLSLRAARIGVAQDQIEDRQILRLVGLEAWSRRFFSAADRR